MKNSLIVFALAIAMGTPQFAFADDTKPVKQQLVAAVDLRIPQQPRSDADHVADVVRTANQKDPKLGLKIGLGIGIPVAVGVIAAVLGVTLTQNQKAPGTTVGGGVF